MDWLYRIYEIASVIGCLSFCGVAVATTGYWSWLVWAPRSERVCAAFGIDENPSRKRRLDDREPAKSRAA